MGSIICCWFVWICDKWAKNKDEFVCWNWVSRRINKGLHCPRLGKFFHDEWTFYIVDLIRHLLILGWGWIVLKLLVIYLIKHNIFYYIMNDLQKQRMIKIKKINLKKTNLKFWTSIFLKSLKNKMWLLSIIFVSKRNNDVNRAENHCSWQKQHSICTQVERNFYPFFNNLVRICVFLLDSEF